MMPTEEAGRYFRATRRDIAVRIAINALAPLGLYALLTHLRAGDFAALAGAAAVPALWTMALWLWRRRVDWIGLFAFVLFAVELVVAALLGGNELLLKTRAAVLTGPLGLVLLVSALIGRPLLLPILRWRRPAAMVRSGALDRLAHDPAAHRRVVQATAIVGAVLFVHAALEIALALSLPTESFLIASKAANWTLAAVAIGLLLLLRQMSLRRR
ncbi:MAG: VC0807 family protein [Xanthobacteraceae bacterium]